MQANIQNVQRFQCNRTARRAGRPSGARVPVPTCAAASKRNCAPTPGAYDLVLSSGFLAFANHAGFLQAVDEAGLPVGGVMGTSAGALSGSLYAAGYSPKQVAQHLSEQAPVSLLRPSLAPWRGGALSLDGVIARLRDLLPPTFEDLPCDFAVGVVTASGQHLLIDSGPLPEAVAASAAIPYIFEAVHVPGTSEQYGLLQDGGCADRIGLRSWRQRRRAQLQHAEADACTSNVGTPGTQGNSTNDNAAAVPGCLVHVIGRSSPFSGADDAVATGEKRLLVMHSPKAQASLTDLGYFREHMEASRARALPELLHVRSSGLKEAVRVAPGSNGSGSMVAAPAGGHVSSGHVDVEASGGSGSGSVGGLAAPPLEWFNVAMSSMDSVMSMERVWAARRMEP